MASEKRNRAEAIALILKVNTAIGCAADWEPDALEVLKAWFAGATTERKQ